MRIACSQKTFKCTMSCSPHRKHNLVSIITQAELYQLKSMLRRETAILYITWPSCVSNYGTCLGAAVTPRGHREKETSSGTDKNLCNSPKRPELLSFSIYTIVCVYVRVYMCVFIWIDIRQGMYTFVKMCTTLVVHTSRQMSFWIRS